MHQQNAMHQQQYLNQTPVTVKPDAPLKVWNDVPYAILYLISVVAVAVAAAFNFKRVRFDGGSGDATESSKGAGALWGSLAIGLVASIAFGLGWLRVLTHPKVSGNIIRFAIFA